MSFLEKFYKRPNLGRRRFKIERVAQVPPSLTLLFLQYLRASIFGFGIVIMIVGYFLKIAAASLLESIAA